MILLDTNVISELMRPRPDRAVVDWLNGQPTEHLLTSAVTIGEIRFGLALLPAGNRRVDLDRRFTRFVAQGFADRVLSFDIEAAAHYGELMAARRRAGAPMTAPDGQIAAIARSNGLDLVTRNERNFADCGISVHNPFGHAVRAPV